jgi:hypothetical protein
MNFLKYILPAVLLLATAHAAPVSIELSGGSVINGELLSWNGKEAQVKAEFGTMTLKREQLSQKALDRLDLQSGDPQKLAAKVSELEATVASLRRDNAALRQQLAQAPASQPATPTSSGAASRPSAPAVEKSGLSYSRSSTGKRHNSNCRYFGSGSPCGPNDGIACKICGG